MNTRYLLMVFLFFALAPSVSRAQFDFGFSHEIGVVVGPVPFQSDFGLRNNTETNRNNVGFGIGIVHYMNFSYRADCNCYSRDTYFNDHFKIRSEIDYHITNFTHEGPLAEKDSPEGNDLRDHKGKSSVFEIGSQLEWFPLSIRDFVAGGYLLAPYITIGAHYVNFNPSYSSVQDNGVTDPTSAAAREAYFDNFLLGDGKLGGIDDSPGSTWALTGSVGIRMKLDPYSDLNLEVRHHRYFSNWVDGLNPDEDLYPANKFNDSIMWIMVGYIYYLDF